MIDLVCASFDELPPRILLDFDDAPGRVHGSQQLALFNADGERRRSLPIHLDEAVTGAPVALSRRRLCAVRYASAGAAGGTESVVVERVERGRRRDEGACGIDARRPAAQLVGIGRAAGVNPASTLHA